MTPDVKIKPPRTTTGTPGASLRHWAMVLVPLVAGLVIGVLDAGVMEVQGPVLLLLVTGALLGALAPERWWQSAILLGIGVPLVHGAIRLGLWHTTVPYDTYS